jgi:hypothetical protein
MTDQAELIEDEDDEIDTEIELETELEDEVEAEEVETEDEDDETSDESNDDEGDEDEVVVQIGEESPPPEEDAQAPAWVKDLRKSHREQTRENKQLKDQLAKLSSTGQTAAVELGKKPSIEGADYDADVYEQQLTDWFDRKKTVEAQAEKVEADKRVQQDAWNATLATYGEHRKSLKVKDFEDAETVVQDELNNTQQGMILQGADNPALVVYALGKNPKKAKEIASIKDPVKFAFAVAKLETQLKVTNRKASTKPESTITGKAQKSGSVDSTLERLRAQAEKTGDMSKVVAYKRSKRMGN